MENYKNYINRQKEEYYKIGTIKCATLNSLVYFNIQGFRHFSKKNGKTRTFIEQRRRFELLKYCKNILESEDIKIEYRISKKTESVAEFWGLVANIDGRKIRVVLRKINNGRLVFLSIMDF